MKNPYAGKPDHHFWRRSVSGCGPEQVDPVVRVPFGIACSDRVATAGSCFAQHIARHLQATRFRYFVSEDRPAFPFSEGENYGTFSARYGNVYAVRQLWQLFQRAYGMFAPQDTAWRRADGRFIDPFPGCFHINGGLGKDVLRWGAVATACERLGALVVS